METIITRRLIMRSFTEKDIDNLYEYASNPKVSAGTGWKPLETKEEAQQLLNKLIDNEEIWAISDKVDGKLIGSIGLHCDTMRHKDINGKMIAYSLSECYWGAGLATEAVREILKYGFETLTLDIITAIHYPHNISSKRVIEKCGFKFEGIIRQATKIYNKEIYDVFSYSILKNEYNIIY